MKYVIIGHPIQINLSHIQPFVYVAWQRLLCSSLICGIQLPGKWDWKMLLHYSRKEYSNHVTQRITQQKWTYEINNLLVSYFEICD